MTGNSCSNSGQSERYRQLHRDATHWNTIGYKARDPHLQSTWNRPYYTIQGTLCYTDNLLDAALSDVGFFRIQDKNSGSIMFTRSGNFKFNASHQIVTDDGYILIDFPHNSLENLNVWPGWHSFQLPVYAADDDAQVRPLSATTYSIDKVHAINAQYNQINGGLLELSTTDLAATLARMLIIARVMALDNRRYYGFLPVLESQYQSSLQINSDCRCYFHLNPNKLPEACVESRRLADLIDRLLPSVAPAMDKN
ncbi:MAG: hypothetical protein KDK30_10430 [Leptospiraceae bacterium]|nr:hypothetical protein [Leptospiraceae bacterium]MCB1314316.1 hypothetical protein [Leptospiraceae bacterium]MCB1320971.1 hypothetical protein [Leptospiraceae bacterium]